MGCAVEYEVFRKQIHDLIRLQSWYVWHLIHARGMEYSAIFGKEALLDFWYWPKFGPERLKADWEVAKQRIFQECAKDPAATETSSLEEVVLDRVAAFVNDPYLDRMYSHYLRQFSAASEFSGFSYAFRKAPEQRIDLHFTNCDVPDSPFRKRRRLIAGLLKLLDKAVDERPDMTRISCGSWLNDLPPFRSLFPPSWTDRIVRAPVAAHGGWWQQFIDRKGKIHRKHERHFRETGEFPFKCSRCGCNVSELERHLRSIQTQGLEPPAGTRGEKTC